MNTISLFLIAVLSGLLFYLLTKVQGALSSTAYFGVNRQPYAAFILSKSHGILQALFEAPLFLTAVCASYVVISSSINSDMKMWSIVFLLFGLGVSALATIHYSAKPAKEFMKAFAAHPDYAPGIFNTVLVFVSLMQTPFIFSLVSIFLAVMKIQDACSNQAIGVIMLAPVLVCFAAWGALRGMSLAIVSLSQVAVYAPHHFKSGLGKIFISLGLIEAPVLFAFLVSLLCMTLNMPYAGTFFIVGFLIFLFIITAIQVSYSSASIIASEIAHWYSNYGLKDSLSRISLLAQIFLDARILYMFIVTLLILFKCTL